MMFSPEGRNQRFSPATVTPPLTRRRGTVSWSHPADTTPADSTFTPQEVPMEKLRQSIVWADTHPKVWLDCVRIFLGLGLFVRGLLLITNSRADFINEMLARVGHSWIVTVALLHYVALAHFVGGAMLTAGLLTRLAAGVQIPVLAGALVLIHRTEGLMSSSQSLEFSALVLFLLVVFAFAGAGPLSVDGDKTAFRHETMARKPAPVGEEA
jgi:putative oxidoreductase